MKSADWLVEVPSEITNDPIWKLEVYRLALFTGDIGWQDVQFLAKKPLMLSVADQPHRSIDSISVNLTEGHSRSKGPDCARFIESSLGSARESREWYYKSRHALHSELVKHRLGLTTRIVSMFVPMVPHQRTYAIREEQDEYNIQPSDFSLDSEVPLPWYVFLPSSFFIMM